VLLNLEHTAPLGEVTAVLLVLSAAFRQAVETLRRHLLQCAAQRHNTRIHLYHAYTDS